MRLGGRTCPTITGAVSKGPTMVPKRNPGKAHPRRNEQRLLQLGQRHRQSSGLVAERPFVDLEAETEPPRSPAIQGLEQRNTGRTVASKGRPPYRPRGKYLSTI